VRCVLRCSGRKHNLTVAISLSVLLISSFLKEVFGSWEGNVNGVGHQHIVFVSND